MSFAKSKPERAPVVVLHEEPSRLRRYLLLMLPALGGSFLFHAALVVLFVASVWLLREPHAAQAETVVTTAIQADQVEKKNETFMVVDIDPTALDFDTEINFDHKSFGDFSIPGAPNPQDAPGIDGGEKTLNMFNIPAPSGFGGGTGGLADKGKGPGFQHLPGTGGGMTGPRGLPIDKSFAGRGGMTREEMQRAGGTTASEAAVARGLQWLIRQQLTDGRWTFAGASDPDPVAATAMGLLPFLAAGKTHLPSDKNPYDKNIHKAIKFLMSQQNLKTGFFGGTMYSHGLATIAMCEAYGLSQDPTLRRSAQRGIDLIVSVQHETSGGWSYSPDKAAPHRDLSISGWQIMALKSGQMAGLNVPSVAITRSKAFLNNCQNSGDDGYAYTPGTASSFRMTAVGLLCRQYMDNWGPSNLSMIKAIKNHIRTNPPDRQDVYYYYYATQVMHHFGGSDWKDWNEKMRESLINKQDVTKSANFGSWSPAGDPWTGGRRLMMTSLNLLTLEVYYRYLPLYYRDAGYSKDKAVQNSF